MGDILEKIFAMILIVILMFFFPLLDSFERMDDLAYMTVYSATREFVDNVRATGKLTPQMYSEFLRKLDSTGNQYDIDMVHRKYDYTKARNKDGEELENYNIRLDDEINKEQILYKIGYNELSSGELVETSPTNNFGYREFKEGDYFYVSVQNTTTTPATVLKKVIYGDNVSELVIVVPYGGMIQQEYIEELEGVL